MKFFFKNNRCCGNLPVFQSNESISNKEQWLLIGEKILNRRQKHAWQKSTKNQELFGPSNFEVVFLGVVQQMVFKTNLNGLQMQQVGLSFQNAQKLIQFLHERQFLNAHQILKCAPSIFDTHASDP